MIAQSNIDPERIRAFALLDSDDSGQLTDIIEKPDPHIVDAAGETALVSMNCFLLTPRIFERAARSTSRSAGSTRLSMQCAGW